MIAWMMIRGGLPVIPGCIAMVTLGFLGGLFLSEPLEGPKQSYNHAIYQGYLWSTVGVESIFGHDALYDKIVKLDDAGKVVKEYESATQFYEENGDGGSIVEYPSTINSALMAVRDFMTFSRGTTATVVFFMAMYMLTEFVLFFLMLAGIKRRGEKSPDIKQLFEVEVDR